MGTYCAATRRSYIIRRNSSGCCPRLLSPHSFIMPSLRSAIECEYCRRNANTLSKLVNHRVRVIVSGRLFYCKTCGDPRETRYSGIHGIFLLVRSLNRSQLKSYRYFSLGIILFPRLSGVSTRWWVLQSFTKLSGFRLCAYRSGYAMSPFSPRLPNRIPEIRQKLIQPSI